jgi:hypothetical protein
MTSLFGSIRVYGSGGTTTLVVAILILLGMAYWRRYRRVNGALEERRPYGLVHALGSAIALAGELISLLLAWLVVTHASNRLAGVVFGVVLGALISTSVFSARSHRVSGVLESYLREIRSFSNSRNASIAGILGFVVGYYYGSFGGGILLAGMSVGFALGGPARRSDEQARAHRDELAGQVAAALGISVPALDELSWGLMPGGGIVINHPGAALLNADRLDERVVKLLPHLEVAEVGPSRIVLSPLSDEVATSRIHSEMSGGLIVAASDAATTGAIPKAPDDGAAHHVINLEDLQ